MWDFQSGWKPLARILVLEEVRAVEERERVRVVREVRRRPVEDHAQAALVQVIDEVHQILGATEAMRGREVAGDLVAPAPEEGVLHERQELDVREAVRERVLGQARRELAVRERAPALVRDPREGARVHLVDRDRRGVPVALAALATPLLVAPAVAVLRDDRGGGWRCLVEPRERVGLLERPPARLNAQLVERALADAGHERLPDPRAADAGHRARRRIPAVERAHDAHGVGVGRPHGEARAPRAIHHARVRAELLVEAIVGALVEEVEIVGAEDRGQRTDRGGLGASGERGHGGLISRTPHALGPATRPSPAGSARLSSTAR
jgi:hypothetical protein